MQNRGRSFSLIFMLALAPMIASQIARLHQATAMGWLICDYAGRLAALGVLAAFAASREVAFRQEARRSSVLEIAAWGVGLIMVYPLLAPAIGAAVDAWIPNRPLGREPTPHGWLGVFDLTVGLALVSFHEETVFRRGAAVVLREVFGDGAVVATSALLFAAYHWTTGLGNMVAVFFFGLYVMLFYRRVGALWPVVAGHFIVDFIYFSGLASFLRW